MAGIVESAIRSVMTKGVEALAGYNRKRLPVVDGPHPFLTGIHTPMSRELTLEELTVTGVLPQELDGRYLRIGPNPVAPDPRGYHWFLGDGMVHGLRLQGGRALWYRNRWIRSQKVGEALGVPAAPGPRFGGFDTVNTNVIGHAGAAWALVEAGSTPVRLGDTLDDQAYDDFAGTLGGSFSAHPRRDPETGELHAITYQGTDPGRIRHVVVDAGGTVRRALTIPVQDGPSIHDCALTPRFVLILDLPVTLSIGNLVGGHAFPYRWNLAHPARLGLLPRDGGVADIIWVPVDPCYVFHTANAFDLADGRVVLDAVVYDRMFADVSAGPDSTVRGLERWTIDPVRRTAERHTLDASSQEFPRIDDRRTGRAYRFCYTLGLPPTVTEALIGGTRLFKHDLEAGTRQTHDFGPGRHPGEAVFVPRSEDAGEDEGWVMCLVVDLPADATDLVILDARGFEEPPVASVRIPHRIPPGFHGNWLPNG